MSLSLLACQNSPCYVSLSDVLKLLTLCYEKRACKVFVEISYVTFAPDVAGVRGTEKHINACQTE